MASLHMRRNSSRPHRHHKRRKSLVFRRYLEGATSDAVSSFGGTKLGVAMNMVRLGHDGSDEAAAWLADFDARGLRGSNLECMSPPGEASPPFAGIPVDVDLGKVYALLPDGQLLSALETQAWAVEKPCIGRDFEWANWDYAQSLKGNRWGDWYEWEYYRFFEAASQTRAQGIAMRSSQLAALRSSTTEESRWWQKRDAADILANMLSSDGFCVLDDFLETAIAEALSSAAHAAWSGGAMGRGRLTSGDDFARADSVLWVNTFDPALAAGTSQVPEDGQNSMGAEQLEPVLNQLDEFVGEVLASRLPRAQAIRTRSHAMFTCYPAASVEDVALGGPTFSSSSSSKGYLRHVDNDRNSSEGRDNGRVLTTILYLNKDWMPSDGGCIRLFESEPPLQCRAEVLPCFNRSIVFWADEVPHEVLAPAKDRFACTFWYSNKEASPSAVAFDRAPAATSTSSSGASGATSVFLD